MRAYIKCYMCNNYRRSGIHPYVLILDAIGASINYTLMLGLTNRCNNLRVYSYLKHLS